jgi:outer membrane lipoprotein-sorting protein
MNRHSIPLLLLATALIGRLALAPGVSRAGEVTPQWALQFQNETPQPLVLPGPEGGLTYYWYMIYKVTNPTDQPLPTDIEVVLKLRIKEEVQVYNNVHDLVAERHIEKKIAERPLHDAQEMAQKPLEPGKTRHGVAIFRVGGRAPQFDTMTITLRGLAARTRLGREGNVQKFRERLLVLHYDYVDSRWTNTKELKYDDESWEVRLVDLTDRTEEQKRAVEESAERLKQLQDRIKKLRERLPQDEPPAETESSAAPVAPGSALARPGPVDAKFIAALAEKAAEHRSVRATFIATIGAGERAQTSSGVLCLHSDGRFALEREMELSPGQRLKEIRVFDGKSLWINTATKALGDSVRRWQIEKTKAQWHSVANRPEVTFANLVNPLRGWRLFGAELTRLGVERLADEAAYVLEVRPAAELRPVLTGPLTGDVLGEASDQRVRFWIGAETGLQHRVKIYDRLGQVVAALECMEVDTDAQLPDERFAFNPPPGVKVIDMNAVMAANDE